MTEPNEQSLQSIRDAFRAGKFEQAQQDLQAYLAAHPDDDAALSLQRHLDELDTLEQIRHVILKRDWDQAISRVQAALEIGLTRDIELASLSVLLQDLEQRRSQEADDKAQALLQQAEEAEKSKGLLSQAGELYAQAAAVPHQSAALQAKIEHRRRALQPKEHETLSTLPSMMQPDALMEQLVGMILKKSRPQVAEAIRLCAVPFWFDLELLSTLRASDDGLDEKILARMSRFSFVHEDEHGRYTFSQDVRAYLLNKWFSDSQGFAEASRRAQGYFLQQLRAAFPDSDAVDALAEAGLVARLRSLVEASPKIGELTHNYLYHTLAADAETGLVLLRRLFRAAAEAHRLALAERFVDVADEQRAWLNPMERAHVDYMRGLLDQLQEKWDASRALFERMLESEGLPLTLQARVRRALGNTLVEQEQWVEAIDLFDVALEAFQADGDELESALTMVNLGRAHLDLALNTWGGGVIFSLGRGWSDRLRDYVMLVSRFPVAIYMMSRLGVRALLPVILRVGRDMDWPIARLFAIAADWFDQAKDILQRLGDEDGLGQVEENLGRLYLTLGHFRRASAIFRGLLAPEDVSLSEYRSAHARLDLAQALMQQGQLTEARELLEQTLSIFVRYYHPARIAETHETLAQTCALEGQSAQAVEHYQRAAQLYHQVGDIKSLTDVVEQMQNLKKLPQTDQASSQAIETTTSQVTQRRYLTRFGLPLLFTFRMLALAGLAGALLFSLFTSLNVASGTDLAVNMSPEIGWESIGSDLDVVLDFKMVPQLESSFAVNFSLYPLIIGTALYLVLYTVLGLWFTVRTPLRTLQEGQSLDIMVDPDGVSRGAEDLPGSLRIQWRQIAAVFMSDRSVLREPIVTLSRFVLFSEQGLLTIDWQTRHALAARDYIMERLHKVREEQVPLYQFGFSILYSRSGWLFFGTLLFMLAFISISQLAPQVLAFRLGRVPYSLSDVYGIAYLGLLIPVGWWFAAQPVRERVLVKPRTRRVWLVGLAGLLLTAFLLINTMWLGWPLGRPNVAPGLFAAFLVGLAAYYIWTLRYWERIPFQRGERVYSQPVRLACVSLALLIIVFALWFVRRELVIHNYQAWGDYHRQQASHVEKDDPAQAQTSYRRALIAYDQALDAHSWGFSHTDDAENAALYHSRGAVLVKLGRYEEAVQSYRAAIKLAPNRTAYYNSLAIAYGLWADESRKAGDQEDALKYYDAAQNQYTLLIQRLKAGSDALATGYLLRASILYRVGEYYRDTDNVDVAASKYRAALADFQRALEIWPDSADVLVGVGWMEYRLADFENDVQRMKKALAYFERASQYDPGHPLAWLNQGQAFIAIGRTHAWYDNGTVRSACSSNERNPSTEEQKLAYQEMHLKALEAFDQASKIVPDNLGLYNKRGRVRYILRNCPDVDNDELDRGAIEDYSRAIELDPDNPEWYDVRGHFYYLLGKEYYPQVISDFEAALELQPDAGLYRTLGGIYRAQGQTDDAIRAYTHAVELRPDAGLYQMLGSLYRAQGKMDEAIQSYSRAVELAPQHYMNHIVLGWLLYQNGDYERSAEISSIAVSLDPGDPRAYFNRGLALVAWGDVRSASRAYEGGIAAAKAITQTDFVLSRYNEALGDLGEVSDDPAGIADALRARLSFRLALVHLQACNTSQARTIYEDGVAIVETLTDQETQLGLYDQAIEDLRDVDVQSLSQCAADVDPLDELDELLELLESARDE